MKLTFLASGVTAVVILLCGCVESIEVSPTLPPEPQQSVVENTPTPTQIQETSLPRNTKQAEEIDWELFPGLKEKIDFFRQEGLCEELSLLKNETSGLTKELEIYFDEQNNLAGCK